MMLINTVLTMPGAMIEAECWRWIAAINVVIVFYNVEKSTSSQPVLFWKCPTTDVVVAYTRAKRQECLQKNKNIITLYQIILLIQVDSSDQRLLICFLYVGDYRLPIRKQT